MGVSAKDVVTIALPNIPERVICLYALNKIGITANFVDLELTGDKLIMAINDVNSDFLISTDTFIKNNNEIIDKTDIKKIVITTIANSLPPLLKVIYTMKNKYSLPYDNRYYAWDYFKERGEKFLTNISKKDSSYLQNNIACILHITDKEELKSLVLTNDDLNSMTLDYHNSNLKFNKKDRYLNYVSSLSKNNVVTSIHLPFIFGMKNVMFLDYQSENFAQNIYKYRINHAVANSNDWNNFLDNIKIKNKKYSFLSTVINNNQITDEEKQKVNKLLSNKGSSGKVTDAYTNDNEYLEFAKEPGRIMFSRDGNKFSPTDIENIINGNENVNSCSVVEIFDEEHNYDKFLVANIVLKSNITKNENKILEEIRLSCEKKLITNNLPHFYISKEKLPLTSNNKINYHELEIENINDVRENVLIKRK